MKKTVHILSAIPISVKLLIFIPFMYFGFTLIPKYMAWFGFSGNYFFGFPLAVIMFVFIAGGLLFFCLKNARKVKYWVCIIVSPIALILSFLLSAAILFSTTIQNLFKGTDFWHYIYQHDAFNDIEPTDTAFNLFMSLLYYLLFVLFWIVVKKIKINAQ
jgi:hypothetical protein